MIDTTEINSFNELETDFKAEIIAYNLWKYHQDIDMIFLKRLGSNNRAFLKDIKEIREEFLDLENKIFSVETYREGLYDYLPEGFFHPPSFNKSSVNIDSIIEQIQKQKRIEKNARQFFLPFEQEFFLSQINFIELENSIDCVESSDTFFNIIEELWPLLKSLNKQDALVFAHMLPYFYSARGKKYWIEKCLSSFLNVEVNVSFISNQINKLDNASQSLVLSEMKLGITSVLTGNHFDGQRNWQITYGPIEYEHLNKYMRGSSLRKLLKLFYDYCVPFTVNVKENFITDKYNYSFKLNENNFSLLGFSTYL